MELVRYIKQGSWPTVLGYLLFIGMMATGYYYNITFVQLGLTDLGERLIGLSEASVATQMAFLALMTCAIALAFGYIMKKLGWSARFRVKLRLAFLVVALQTILTLIAPLVKSESGFFTWIVFASLALGIGMPATFSMTVDLIPRRDRGYAGALITAAAYFAAEVFSSSWLFENFRSQILWVMVPGVLGIGALAFAKFPFLEQLASQHSNPEFAYGRFVQRDASGGTRVRRSLIGLLILMFGIYFVDSLGFLRLLDTPLYMQTAWQSTELNIRLAIGVTHVIAALIAGVLYTYMHERNLFLWIFGIFAITHLEYTLHIRIGASNYSPLSMPLMYALAVSLYTVLNFSIWADISTPRTISLNAAIGVALSGWSATFISTALAIRWNAMQMPLERHLQIVDSLAFLFFLGMIILIFFQSQFHRPGQSHRPGQERQTSKQQEIERRSG